MRFRATDIVLSLPGRSVLGGIVLLGAWRLGMSSPFVAGLLLALIPAGVMLLYRIDRSRRELGTIRAELVDRRTEIETLHAIGREIVSSPRPEQVFATVERECRKILEFEVCVIALIDRRAGVVAAAFRHRRRRATEIGRDLPLRDLAVWAREAKRPARVDDVAELPQDAPLRGDWLAPETRSCLVVPLLVEGETIGALAIESEKPRTYDDHDLVLLTTVAQQAAIAIESARRHELATVDSLTGLFVRDYFFSRLREEDDRARRYGGGFALLMVDLDGFKEINDRHGHLAGDQYLSSVATAIRGQLRGADVACRYGGDEFCLLLPQTGAAGARAIAERIRGAVADHIVSSEGLALRTTVSIGLAVFPDHDSGEMRDLLRRADEALYRAKRAGRDRVVPFAA